MRKFEITRNINIYSFCIELGADLRQGTELIRFEQNDDGVTAFVRERDGGREYQIYAQYLIAADGFRSSNPRSFSNSPQRP